VVRCKNKQHQPKGNKQVDLSPEAFDELNKRLSEPPKFLPRLAELLELTKEQEQGKETNE